MKKILSGIWNSLFQTQEQRQNKDMERYLQGSVDLAEVEWKIKNFHRHEADRNRNFYYW